MKEVKNLLIVGNKASVHTNNLAQLVGGYFDNVKTADGNDFSLRKPLHSLKAIYNTKRLLRTFKPNIIILYQVDLAAFCVTLIKKDIPTLVVGIGSDILIVPNKSFINKFIAKYVINHGNYFNAGSIAIKTKMEQLSDHAIDVVIANLGTNDIVKAEKRNIIYSNRLHKDLYNIDKIIASFAVFVADERRRDWRLIIAAEGQEEKLRNMAKELHIEDKVEFVGWLDNAKNAYYYSVAKIWVSLPLSDSVSISLLEAMSAQCIPVCYDVPALQGFLVNNKNAVIVNDFNENFFERALLLDKSDILEENRRQARNFSDKEINRQRFYAIFDKALHR